MTRLLMTAFAGLLSGIAVWCMVGYIAAEIFTRTGTGGHDGGGAMVGFFVIGGMGGIVGAIAGAMIVWKVLGDPARMGTVAAAIFGLLAIEIIALIVVMTPKHEVPNDFPPGKRGEMQVEVKFSAEQMAAFKKHAVLYELRAGSGDAETPWLPAQHRAEGDREIVPGIFGVQEVRTWVFAVMDGEKQLGTATVGIDRQVGKLGASTQWSAWEPMDASLEVRWRFAVLGQLGALCYTELFPLDNSKCPS